MANLVESYNTKLVEPGCAPGSGRYGVQIALPVDISAVFPYLNALAKDAFYDHENQILIMREPGKAFAYRPREVMVARIADASDAQEVAEQVIEKINRVWVDRANITPRYTEKRLPTVMELYKLLPRTNCGKCGYVSCLAFAAARRLDTVKLDNCIPLSEPQFTQNKQKFLDIFASV